MNNFINSSMTVDVDAIFEPASWQIKIDFINQFILNNNVLISVLGESGSGKTTFGHLLQDKLDSNVRSAMISVTPLFDPTLFLDQLCSMLNIESKLSIADIAAEMSERKFRSLIIVDNAEQLPEAFVKEILDALKQQEGNEFFHVCLLSDFSLVKMTSRLARELYKDMIHSIELHPLCESESKEYVEWCMALSDEPQPPLTDEWMHQFYLLTEGNIASMNTHRLSFFVKKVDINHHFYKRFLSYGAIPVFLVAAIGIGYFLFPKSPDTVPELNMLAENSINTTQIELPLTSNIPDYQMASVHQPMQVISLQKADLFAQNDEVSDDRMDESLVVMDKVVPIPKVVSSTVRKRAVKRVAKVSVVKAKRVAPILPGRYTLQLMASREKSVLTRLARKYPVSAHVKVRRFDNHGVNWYVLIQGDYSQKTLAKHALLTLPKSLAQFKPWIRSTDNLKDIG